MNTRTVISWGWRILLVSVVLITTATVNQPRTGQAERGPARRTRADGAAKQSRPTKSGPVDLSPDRDRPRNSGSGSIVRSLGGYTARSASTSTASAAGGVIAPLCSQGANCQAPNHAAAHTSDRTSFRVADDFRPDANGNISQICWWGIYTQNAVDCNPANVIDTFEIKYCTDGGSLPSTTCTTFRQSDGSLTVSGPTQTAEMVFLATAEFVFSATHADFPVTAGQCYWVEITNDSGTCVWSWEASAEGGDWAMADGDGTNPPDGYDLSEFLSRDLAFCVDVTLSADAACGPPENAACSSATNDCCVEGPLDATGCNDDECCRKVCACDPLCCDPAPGWDLLCATNFLGNSLCNAESVCPSVCNPCGGAESGDCCDANGSANCDDAACCAAVCAVDEFCCDGEWDAFCVVKAEILCPALCAPEVCGNPETEDCCTPNPFVAGCLDATCCEAVCACDIECCGTAFGWDSFCATTGFGGSGCGAELLCPDLCLCGFLCGDLDGSGASVNGPGSNADLLDYYLFANCFGLIPNGTNQCLCADLDGDGDIDEVDYALLVALFESSSLNGPPDCGPQ